MQFLPTWINLVGIILKEANQKERDKIQNNVPPISDIKLIRKIIK